MTADTPARQQISALGWLRISLRGLSLALALPLCIALYLICKPFTAHNPAPRIFLKAAGFLLGLRVSVQGEPRRRAAFLLSNHVSWLDIPALGGLTGTAFVAHDGLAAHSWLRWLCRMNDTVFIARHDRTSIARQVEQVRQALHETGLLTVFAEGTTGPGDKILPFKSSLLSALSPAPQDILVQPIWLDYWPRPSEIAWLDGETGKENFLRIAARARPIGLTVHFLPPLAQDTLTSRKSIASASHGAIVRQMQNTNRQRDQRVAL